jgi:hypothetical protein
MEVILRSNLTKSLHERYKREAEKTGKIGYCYVFNGDTLLRNKGFILDGYRRGGKTSMFVDDDTPRSLAVPREPGVVLHGCVWLLEGNDTKAKELMIENQMSKIQNYFEEIEKCKRTIEVLRN